MACMLGCRGRLPPPKTYAGALSKAWLLYLRISSAEWSLITRRRVVTFTGTGWESALRLPSNCFAYANSLGLDILTSVEPLLVETHNSCKSRADRCDLVLKHGGNYRFAVTRGGDCRRF